MGWNPWDKVVTLETACDSFQQKLCSSQKKCGVIESLERPQKSPGNKSCWKSPVLLSRKETGLRGGLRMVFNRQKILHYQSSTAPCACWWWGACTIMSLNGKERQAGQKLGEYLMLNKMTLTGVEISLLRVKESRCRNQDRMGSVLGQRIEKIKEKKNNWVFFLLSSGFFWPINYIRQDQIQLSLWQSSGSQHRDFRSPKGWNHWTGGTVKSKQ